MTYVGVLGPVLVRGPERIVDLGPRRHAEVVAALAVDAGHVVSAERVLARVWGDDAAISMTSLHALVSRLRGRLRNADAEGVLVTRPPGYLLDLGVAEVDAVVFAAHVLAARRLVAAGDAVSADAEITSALNLWRGRPYADVRGDYIVQEAARLDDLWLAAHELRAEVDLNTGRHERLLDTLPALVAHHPLREPLRGALMLAQYRTGYQADALTTYDEGREVLAGELGIDPGPDLQRLWTRILQQDPALEVARALRPDDPAVALAPASQDRIVGRAEQMALLDRVVRAAANGAGATACVVMGEAGIGKTRLVGALVDGLAHLGNLLVATGACWEHEGAPPYWPWEQALTALVESMGVGRARDLLGDDPDTLALVGLVVPPLLGAVPPSPGDAVRVRLFDALRRLLQRVTAERPVLLVLEDVHWADTETVQLWDALVRTAGSARLALLATMREDDARGRAVAAQVLGPVTRTGGHVIQLAGLDANDAGALVEQHLGTSLAPGVAADLRDRTDGNPFYLVELTRLLDQQRQRTGRADIPVPRGIRAVVESRLGGLSTEDRDVLAAAAIVGRDVDPRILGEVLARDRTDLAVSLDHAADHGLLVAGAGGRPRFAHALVREVLEESVGPVLRATLHAQVAESLARLHEADLAPHAGVIAYHFQAAGVLGDLERAVRFALLAADYAAQRLALDDAERTLTQLLETMTDLSPAIAEPLELQARTRLGTLLSQRLGYDHPLVAEQRGLAIRLARRSGRPDALLAGLWGLFGTALVAGELMRGEALANNLHDAAEGTQDPWLAIAAAQASGQLMLLQGRFAESVDYLRRGIDLARTLPSAPLEVFVQDPHAVMSGWLAAALTLMGGAEEAEKVTRAAADLMDTLDHAYTTSYLEILFAWMAVWTGRPEQAVAHSGRAIEVATAAGFGQFETFALAPGAWGRAHLGDVATASEQIDRAMAVHTQPDHRMFGTLMASVRADVDLLSDDAEAALATSSAGISAARRTGEVLLLPRLLEQQAEARRRLDAARRRLDARRS